MNKKYINNVVFRAIFSFCLCALLVLNFSNIYATNENVQSNSITEKNNLEEVDKDDNTSQSLVVSGIIDTKLQDGIYKYSENDVPYLPFIRYSTDRILIDKEIGGIGLSFSATSVEVTSKTSGIQVLFANDAVRINAPMEYAIIFGGGSVTIDSEIQKDVIIYGGNSVTITENGKVNGNLICYSSSIDLKGEVLGSVVGASSNVTVDGKIRKDLRVQTYNINIADENTVSGNVYLETYNKLLSLDEKYNANIIYLEQKESGITFETITRGIVNSLLYCLVYLFIVRKNDGKILDKALRKTTDNLIFITLSSSIFLALLPLAFLVLFTLSLVGFSAVTTPILIVIIVAFILVCLLSTFIVGSVLGRYMQKNYFSKYGLSTSIFGCFIIYMMLYILTKIPAISIYVVLSLIILSTGITLTYILKKDKN